MKTKKSYYDNTNTLLQKHFKAHCVQHIADVPFCRMLCYTWTHTNLFDATQHLLDQPA